MNFDRLNIPITAEDRIARSVFARARGQTQAFARGASADLAKVQGRLVALRAAALPATAAMARLSGIIGGVGLITTTLFVKRMAEAADEIDTTAKAVGLTAEELQEYRYATGQAGIDTARATTSIQYFTKALGQALQGTGEAKRGLDDLGIGLDDIRGKAPLDILSMVADRLKDIQDPLRRNAILAELFGRSGLDMAALLNQGGKAIDDLRAKARRLGIVVSDEMISRAAAASAEFKTLGAVFQAAGINLAAEFLPSLRSLAETITSPEFQRGVKEFASAIGAMVNFIANNIDVIERFAGIFAGMRAGAAIGGLIPHPWARLIGAGVGGLAGGFAPELIGAAQGPPPLEITVHPQVPVSPAADGGTGGGGLSDAELEAQARAWEKQVLTIRQRTEALKAETAAVGLSRREIEKRKVQLELEQFLEQQGIAITPQLVDQIDQLSASYADAAIAAERMQASAEELRNLAGSFLKGFVSDLRNGVSAVDALGNALGRLADQLIEIAINRLVENAFGALLGGLGGGAPAASSVPLPRLRPAGFARGGITDRPAIFGEDGWEAAVPLDGNRRIPVTLSMPDLPRAPSVAFNLSIVEAPGTKAEIRRGRNERRTGCPGRDPAAGRFHGGEHRGRRRGGADDRLHLRAQPPTAGVGGKMASWPSTLPYDPVSGSFRLRTPFRAPHRTDFEDGPRRRRRSTTKNIATIEFALRMSRDEFQVFRAWVRDDLVDGTLEFTMPIWTGHNDTNDDPEFLTRTCSFAEPYDADPQGGFLVDVALSLDVEDY